VVVTAVTLLSLLNDEYKMEAVPGRRFLKQPATKLEPVIVVVWCR